MDLGNVGVFKQRADNGVFAAAWANDEYLHSLQGYFVWSARPKLCHAADPARTRLAREPPRHA
ncbi:hypothetical protein GCM10010212_08140 [Paenarthrobacter nicotinovorans]|nr:hypothetical protein NtRootA2_33010 [Arthrobacter sp. NtRootA2]BCW28704.1 hypothetical protein NtRootC45_33040 [Arthrobacter sp. NtRootC45]GGV24561.1 hypothetical protein GCM10010212_08140 [Paenarthrobacter nicotinovorans]